MIKLTSLLTASVFTVGLMISTASAFQAAPPSSEQAKESMEKVEAKKADHEKMKEKKMEAKKEMMEAKGKEKPKKPE